MQREVTAVFRKRVGLAVEGEGGTGNPVGIAPEQAAKRTTVVAVGGDIAKPQQDVVVAAVPVGRFDADHAATEIGDAHAQMVVLQREQRRGAPVR